MSKSVRDIVREYLVANGYDGLAGDECGCDLDDLMTCGESGALDCAAGFKHDNCKLAYEEWGMGKCICTVKDCKDCTREGEE
jgi:hypothetical protein